MDSNLYNSFFDGVGTGSVCGLMLTRQRTGTGCGRACSCAKVIACGIQGPLAAVAVAGLEWCCVGGAGLRAYTRGSARRLAVAVTVVLSLLLRACVPPWMCWLLCHRHSGLVHLDQPFSSIVGRVPQDASAVDQDRDRDRDRGHGVVPVLPCWPAQLGGACWLLAAGCRGWRYGRPAVDAASTLVLLGRVPLSLELADPRTVVGSARLRWL